MGEPIDLTKRLDGSETVRLNWIRPTLSVVG